MQGTLQNLQLIYTNYKKNAIIYINLAFKNLVGFRWAIDRQNFFLSAPGPSRESFSIQLISISLSFFV